MEDSQLYSCPESRYTRIMPRDRSKQKLIKMTKTKTIKRPLRRKFANVNVCAPYQQAHILRFSFIDKVALLSFLSSLFFFFFCVFIVLVVTEYVLFGSSYGAVPVIEFLFQRSQS